MIWMVKNIKDDRVVFKHKDCDRYYVGSFDDYDCKLKLFTTESLHKAYDVLEAIKYHLAGINVDGWRIVQVFDWEQEHCENDHIFKEEMETM